MIQQWFAIATGVACRTCPPHDTCGGKKEDITPGKNLDRHHGASEPEVPGDRRPDAARQGLRRWGKYQVEYSIVLEQELFPISITLTGNVAVVQYNYQVARENHKKEREMVTGNYTDVLLKENGRRQFLTWSGGDQPKN